MKMTYSYCAHYILPGIITLNVEMCNKLCCIEKNILINVIKIFLK